MTISDKGDYKSKLPNLMHQKSNRTPATFWHIKLNTPTNTLFPNWRKVYTTPIVLSKNTITFWHLKSLLYEVGITYGFLKIIIVDILILILYRIDGHLASYMNIIRIIRKALT